MTETLSAPNPPEFQNGDTQDYETTQINQMLGHFCNPEMRLVDINYFDRITLIVSALSRQTESTPNLTIDHEPATPNRLHPESTPPPTTTIAVNNQLPVDVVVEQHAKKNRSKFSLKRFLFCKQDNLNDPAANNTVNKKLEKNIPGNCCVICLGGIKVYACIPCGHKILCEKCRKTAVHLLKRCPVCRTKTERILRIYD